MDSSEANYYDGNKKRKFLWKNRIFCICMTQTMVSEAPWQIYSSGKIGVQFRINRDVLLQELKNMEKDYNIYIGRVEYMNTDDIMQDLSQIPFSKKPIVPVYSDTYVAQLLMLKRVAFQYEDEIRIMLVSKDSKNFQYKKGIKMPYQCENTDLIQRIVLDPSLEKMTFAMVKNLLVNKYNFKSYFKDDGTEFNRVLKSNIYNDKGAQIIHF